MIGGIEIEKDEYNRLVALRTPPSELTPWLKLKFDVLRLYGNKCVCCGETQIEFLTIDHVQGGGADDRKKYGVVGIYTRLREQGLPLSADYRVLCMNCNWGSRYSGDCPHKKQWIQLLLEREQQRQRDLESRIARALAQAYNARKIYDSVHLSDIALCMSPDRPETSAEYREWHRSVVALSREIALVIRARWHIDVMSRGGHSRVFVTRRDVESILMAVGEPMQPVRRDPVRALAQRRRELSLRAHAKRVTNPRGRPTLTVHLPPDDETSRDYLSRLRSALRLVVNDDRWKDAQQIPVPVVYRRLNHPSRGIVGLSLALTAGLLRGQNLSVVNNELVCDDAVATFLEAGSDDESEA